MQISCYLDEGAYIPVSAHEEDAGYDLFARESQIVPANGSATFDTGVHLAIPGGYCGVLMSKSGLNVRQDITSTGLIDAGYTGSITVKLYNSGDEDYFVKEGDKISQIVILAMEKPHLALTNSPLEAIGKRGNGGFGSTGR